MLLWLIESKAGALDFLFEFTKLPRRFGKQISSRSSIAVTYSAKCRVNRPQNEARYDRRYVT